MNKKAQELNLTNTHFVTPHGLDNSEHYTTAYELALLTDYALQNSKFAEIVNTKTYTITINGHPKIINNTNELLGYLNGVNGVKTGFTNNAGRCLVTSTTRNNWQIISVVLGADTKKIRTKDSINLIEYSFNNFELVNIKNIIEEKYAKWKTQNEGIIKINKGVEEHIQTSLEDIPYELYPINKNQVKDIECVIDNVNYIQAPVLEGDIIGELCLKIGNKTICSLAIKCSRTVEKKNVWDYFSMLMYNAGTYLVN